MSLFLLSFILFGSKLIEAIPLAALIGVMFFVAEKTFEWGSLTTLRKIPRSDAFLVIAVTVITVFNDLAVAVVLGVVIAALVFAWQHAKQINVKSLTDDKGWKVYELEGSLFFASIAKFQDLFDPKNDPIDVVIEFKRAKVMDQSAIEAIDSLAGRYQSLGKRLHLRHLSPDCLELLGRAKEMVEVNAHEDPHYHIADNRLG
jgi:SulP family sulfate permease